MRTMLRRAAAPLAGIAMILAIGCDGGASVPRADTSTEQATVTGTVTIKGKPATGGQISFDGSNVSRKTAAAMGPIGTDGTYSVKAYLGSNSVIVTAPGVGYNNSNCTVNAGDNKFDVTLP